MIFNVLHLENFPKISQTFHTEFFAYKVLFIYFIEKSLFCDKDTNAGRFCQILWISGAIGGAINGGFMFLGIFRQSGDWLPRGRSRETPPRGGLCPAKVFNPSVANRWICKTQVTSAKAVLETCARPGSSCFHRTHFRHLFAFTFDRPSFLFSAL